MEQRYQQLIQRINKVESKLVQLEEQQKEKEIEENIREDLYSKQVYSFKFFKVPKHYYDLTLPERATILGGNVPQLCKSIIFENTVCNHQNFKDPTDSRFYLVVIQYQGILQIFAHCIFLICFSFFLSLAKINTQLLRNFIHSLKPPSERLSKNSFNFQLASEEDSYRLSGFEHNAVTPYGMREKLPVIVCSRLLEVKPAVIYLGGGLVDKKLLISVDDLVRSLDAKIGLVTEAREP